MQDYAPLIGICCAYFAPTIIAAANDKAAWSDVGGIMMLNLFVGWTVIGWLFASYLAVTDFKQRRIDNDHKARVNRARDEFYLREAERAKLH